MAENNERFRDRLKHGWNAFINGGGETEAYRPFGSSSSGYGPRPYVGTLGLPTKNNLVIPIYNRIAIDVASVDIRHVRLDKDHRYLEDIDSFLQECLSLSANMDQISRSFFQDAVMTLCERGVIAIVPTDTTINPLMTGGYDIKSLRVGYIVEWKPFHVRVSVYRESSGQREELVLPKTAVAIVENPLYPVMNEHNSILQRLLRKLSLLDNIDEISASGKIDIIMQLPYTIKTEAKRAEADKRRKDVEDQMRDSSHGIIYTDGTERITQLNRPAENNLLQQVESLTRQLYSQLGITEEIFNGTAKEAAMINYFNRTIEPFLTSITMSMKRTFLTKTARSQGQSIEFYRDPFKLVPVFQIAEIADKFTRNEIASTNDIRTQVLGWKPSKDPKADRLVNSNITQSKEETDPNVMDAELVEEEVYNMIASVKNRELNELE